jgi:dUTPase
MSVLARVNVFGTYRCENRSSSWPRSSNPPVLDSPRNKALQAQQSGTIDADYRGEIKFSSTTDKQILPLRDERIAQMVVAKYEAMNLYQVNGLDKTSVG